MFSVENKVLAGLRIRAQANFAAGMEPSENLLCYSEFPLVVL
jgi:hypothetical protein